MHFYEYYSQDEVIDNPCLLAALSLVEHKLEVVPIKTGTKEPSDNINSLAKLRQHPLHKLNVDYYFDRDVEIAIMLRRNMEVIDIDSKNKKGLSEEFLYALRAGWNELYEKLVISKTPTGGLHILYFSEIVGGRTVLAQVDSSPNPLTIIERLNESNKNYIKCCPSKGYEFIQGSPMDMPHLTAEERNWLSALAASFNKVQIPEVKKADASREDSPWTVFNTTNNWQYIWTELKERGWDCSMDLTDRLVIKRAGSNQHSGSIWKDSNTLYLFSSSSEFKPETGYSPFGVYCHYYHDGNIALACRQLASEGIGKNIYDEGQFWIREKTKIKIKYTELTHWLHSIGYRVYENNIVKITSNIISIIEERTIKAVFLNEVEPEMQDHFYEKVAKIFSQEGGLMAMLQPLDDNFIRDTKTETWLFFKNYAVKITDAEILPLQYKEIEGYIWEDAIIDRNFYNDDFTSCDAERFTQILGGLKFADLQKLIGYTISRYKDPINPRAVVLTEDIDADEEGESQGGSGKGLLFSFVRQFRKVADFDGKNFKTADTFLYQNIEPDTNIIFIDDVERHFKFTSLFSILTGSLLVNKKNKPQMILPYDKSPKIFITSNFSVGAMDISSTRRKYEFAVVKHFGSDYEPVDEFKRQFFSEWDKNEWSKFDNFIANCCMMYLKENDKKHIGNITANSSERALLSNTNKDFIEYMDAQLSCNFFDIAPQSLKNFTGYINGTYTTNGVNYQVFKENMNKPQPDPSLYIAISKEDMLTKMNQLLKLKQLTMTKLTQWIKKWATSRNVTIDTKYRRGNNLEMCYHFIDFKSVQPSNESEQVNNEEPFTLF